VDHHGMQCDDGHELAGGPPVGGTGCKGTTFLVLMAQSLVQRCMAARGNPFSDTLRKDSSKTARQRQSRCLRVWNQQTTNHCLRNCHYLQ
jgi:hypothetical protein